MTDPRTVLSGWGGFPFSSVCSLMWDTKSRKLGLGLASTGQHRYIEREGRREVGVSSVLLRNTWDCARGRAGRHHGVSEARDLVPVKGDNKLDIEGGP